MSWKDRLEELKAYIIRRMLTKRCDEEERREDETTSMSTLYARMKSFQKKNDEIKNLKFNPLKTSDNVDEVETFQNDSKESEQFTKLDDVEKESEDESAVSSIPSWLRNNISETIKSSFLSEEPFSDESWKDWNIYNWIRIGTEDEAEDAETFAERILDAYRRVSYIEPFWFHAGVAYLKVYLLHHAYMERARSATKNFTELPSFTPQSLQDILFCEDISPSSYIKLVLEKMKSGRHILEDEFFEEPVRSYDGTEIHQINLLQKLYGEYIEDFSPFNHEFGYSVNSLAEVRSVLREKKKAGLEIDWTAQDKPYHLLLMHPIVRVYTEKLEKASFPTQIAIYYLVRDALHHFISDVTVTENIPSACYYLYLSWRDNERSLYLLLGNKTGDLYFTRVPHGHEPMPWNEQRMYRHPDEYKVYVYRDGSWRYVSGKWYGGSDDWEPDLDHPY